MPEYFLDVDLWWIWGSKTFVTYNYYFSEELFNFASMTPHRSAPGSPSKASELDFIILKG